MRSFEINVTTAGSLDPILAALNATENQVLTAAVRALNKTAIWLRAQSVTAISQQKQIKQNLIRERLRIIRANRASLKAFVIAKLYGVKACKLGTMRQTSTGVSVGGYDFPHAFIATMPTGHTGVFQRKGTARLPIKEATVELEPEASETIGALVELETSARFVELFRHELTFMLRVRP